jgi:hypothetical protein
MAGILVQHDRAAIAAQLVRERQTISKDWRLSEWLKQQAAQRGDVVEVLALAEQLFRQRPSVDGHQPWLAPPEAAARPIGPRPTHGWKNILMMLSHVMMKPMTRLANPNCSSIGGMNELKMGHTMLMPKNPKPRMNVLLQGKDRCAMFAPVKMTALAPLRGR